MARISRCIKNPLPGRVEQSPPRSALEALPQKTPFRFNQPYSARFWQMKGKSPYTLRDLFGETMSDPSTHMLMGLYNGKPVCEIDVYHVRASELGRHIPAAITTAAADCGLHFLMAPPKETFKGLSAIMLRAFMDAYFAYPYSGDLYAEPDELNILANRLAVRAGFDFIKRINLPDKMANLYRMTRRDYLSRVPLMNV